MAYKSLIGFKFGRLTVISRDDNTKSGKAKWICRCDCGRLKNKSVTSSDLKSGKVKSCGCIYCESNKERNKTHGKTHTRLYNIWCSMKARCNVPNSSAYKDYGGRGITICREWQNDFQAFYDWAIANGYAENLSIDRIDADGNYEPSNCRWTSMKKQENNRRNNRIVVFSGKKYTVAELSDLLLIPYATLLNRINSGWKECELGIAPNLNNKNIRRAI
jgi:hypothetical protein